jgi:hypothetical protein
MAASGAVAALTRVVIVKFPHLVILNSSSIRANR